MTYRGVAIDCAEMSVSLVWRARTPAAPQSGLIRESVGLAHSAHPYRVIDEVSSGGESLPVDL